ncbi:hypothetical protein BB559_004261 [Furculomyces boomerangus]|uniref:Peptidase S1 domain-containing protein n=1 Tax=Furculomyces boomerangus TaxID=61424 RepID=A0A2T9YFN9_9FUNG|nr:hypothetical protein BB559_004261 [Furculomyces boomerangus]
MLSLAKLTLLGGTVLAGINASAIKITHEPLLSKRITVIPNVMGGTYSNIANVKSIAYFGLEGETDFRCTASLIAPNVVITAAHCITNSNATDSSGWSNIRIGVGSVEPLPQNPNSYTVKSIIMHPDYINAPPFKNDIALIYLNECVPSTIATPIDMAAPDMGNEQYIAAGFGQTSETDKSPTNVLEIIATEGNQDICQEFFSTTEIGTTVICIAQTNGSGTCYGDAGSPLYSDDYSMLLGVESAIVGVNGQDTWHG